VEPARPAGRAGRDDPDSLRPEASVNGDKIPEDHARELADCFAACASGLFGYACVLTRGDRAMAEDLVQVTFMAAAGQWARVRCLCQSQRRSWLRTTLGNLAVSAFRRNEAFRDRLPRLEAMYRPPPADTHAEALQAIALERGWQTIRCLPPQQHAVAAMRWLLGMKSSEIATTLGIADGTVAAHLSAVRAKLRADVGPYDPFGDDEEGAPS
jgi:RNA polymerase sigma-70 factor, ECF subfamily